MEKDGRREMEGGGVSQKEGMGGRERAKGRKEGEGRRREKKQKQKYACHGALTSFSVDALIRVQRPLVLTL